jgi:hypothetical protein
VAPIEGEELTLPEPLSGSDDGGVDRSERQVPVGAGEFRDPDPVGCENRFGDEIPGREVTEKADLGIWAEPRPEQIHDLGDDEDGNNERTLMRLEDLKALLVMPVVTVDVGIQRPCIDDEGDQATSARRIVSICSDTSETPLAPAPAASSRRRPRPALPR